MNWATELVYPSCSSMWDDSSSVLERPGSKLHTLRFFSSSDFISAVDSASTSSANAEVVVGLDDRAGASDWLHVR